MTEFDLGLRRSLWLRSLRRWALILGALWAFFELEGVPHIRWTDSSIRYRRPEVTYWSIFGSRPPLTTSSRSPLIVIFPLERPLIDHAMESALATWRWLTKKKRSSAHD